MVNKQMFVSIAQLLDTMASCAQQIVVVAAAAVVVVVVMLDCSS